MVFKFFKNTIFKGKLYRKGVTYEIADAESLEKRGFGEVVEDETNTEDTNAPGEDETNTEDKKSVSQSTAKKKGK